MGTDRVADRGGLAGAGDVGGRWRDTGFVFTAGIGMPIEPTNVNKHFDRLVVAAGVPKTRFHDQRHWCATLLLAQEAPPRVVTDLLGHTDLHHAMDLSGHVLGRAAHLWAASSGAPGRPRGESKSPDEPQ